MRKNTLLLIVLSSLLFSLNLASSFGQEEYANALQAAKTGDREFAFMNFLYVARNDPSSTHREKGIFATGEYYYLSSNYTDAFNTFKRFLNDYPDSKMKPFALFYILKLAQILNEDTLAKEITKQIINQERVILLFKKSKAYTFKSPLGMNYQLVHYIDRLEFYIDGKLHAQIFY